jgi:MFS family permease
LAGGFLTLFCSSGIWHSFGVFFKPLLAEFGLDRTALSLVTSIAIVTIALSQLVIGWILEKAGPSLAVRVGLTIMGAGLILSGFAPGLTMIYLTFSVVMAVGYGLSSLVSIGNVIAQWFSRRRGMAMGIAFAGFSAGALVLTPLAQYLILRFSWRTTFWILGVSLWIVVIPLLFLLIRDREEKGQAESKPNGKQMEGGASHDVSVHIPPREALRTSSFWLLSATYFACGFTDFLLFFHFPIFAIGLGVPDQTAANILGLAGGISIFGTVAISWLSDRVGRPIPLFVSYAIRAVGFLVLMTSQSAAPLYAFMVFYGFVMFSSNPITSAVTRELYGPKSFGTLYGYLIFMHYVGSFFGPLTGGIVYDRLGRYDEAFLIGAILLAMAAVCSLALRWNTGFRRTGVEAAGMRV